MSTQWTEIAVATGETLYMVTVATAVACAVGLPLGFAVVTSGPRHLWPRAWAHRVLQTLINVLRSVPFVILMIVLMPFTRWLVGTSIGLHAAIVPLALGATPFFARLVELSLTEVDYGMIEMGRAIGASNWQIVRHILFPEAKSGILSGVTICVVTLVGYSAMAGVVGGGGLGDLAIRHGYQRFQAGTMIITTALLVALVQILQEVGEYVARRANKRTPYH